MDQHFRHSRRLLNAQDFKNVFSDAQFKSSHRYLLVLAKRNPYNEARLGVIISKKNCKRAVDRNRFKRLVRNNFRLSNNNLNTLDIIILARFGVHKIKNKELTEILTKQLFNINQKAQA